MTKLKQVENIINTQKRLLRPFLETNSFFGRRLLELLDVSQARVACIFRSCSRDIGTV